jgi:methylated-DNA-[protein]-cysteine S-methyltransferase
MLHFETAIGTCGVRWTEQGISEISIRPRGAPTERAAPEPVRAAIEAMRALLAGEHRDLTDIVLDLSAVDDFRRAVYEAARAIPPGETVSYGEIARRIGAPDAARAVGAALGSNPCPIVVPCHRVLASDGTLHGFSAPGGIATKRQMLEIECAPGFLQAALF